MFLFLRVIFRILLYIPWLCVQIVLILDDLLSVLCIVLFPLFRRLVLVDMLYFCMFPYNFPFFGSYLLTTIDIYANILDVDFY